MELIGIVSNLDGGTRASQGKLEECARGLAAVTSLDEFRELVSSLITETKEALEANHRFVGRLSETSDEIGLLRQELAAIRRQISVDPLTGIANRRAFEDGLGVTGYWQGDTAESVFDRADRALYSAKRGGRNRTV